MKPLQRLAFYLILVAALGSRIALALLNREANDDHMEVIRWILQRGSLPTKADCWECFQPKLFHITAASLLKITGISNPDGQIVLVQMLNLAVSLLLFWGVWKLLQRLDFGDMNGKILTFGLIILNPNLVSTDIQATNDTFVIAFSTLTIYFAYTFMRQRQRRDFILLTLFSVLAASSKANGTVAVMGIAAFFGLCALVSKNFTWRWADGLLAPTLLYGLLTLLLVALNPLNQYVENQQRYGSPVVLNMDRSPWPGLFTPTEVNRPGILSIQDGFFTFKFFDLLKEPQITRDNKVYPPHRTSFWTILYGRANFIQYNPWPLSWSTDNWWVRMLGRLIYLLALFPTGVMLLGMLRAIGQSRSRTGWENWGLFLCLISAFLGFAILYALEYRIYTVIKTIFIYPAIASLGVMHLVGYEWLKKVSSRTAPILAAIYGLGVSILLLAYFVDIFALIAQLAKI